MQYVSLPSTSTLFRELLCVVLLKLALLGLLGWAFFADPGPALDSEAVGQALLARADASAPFGSCAGPACGRSSGR